MSFLPAITFDLGNRHALDTDAREGIANIFELERFDDRDHEFHEYLAIGDP